MSGSDSDDFEKKYEIVIDSCDIHCPVTLEKYTDVNYPVTLICGHTISVNTFQSINRGKGSCPSCRKAFPNGHTPQRNILWSNIVNQVRPQKKNVYCSRHPKKRAVAMCFVEKMYLCSDCLNKDKHSNYQVITLKKLEQEKRPTSLGEYLGVVGEKKIRDYQVQEITRDIRARIEPFIQQVVSTNLELEREESVDVITIKIIELLQGLIKTDISIDIEGNLNKFKQILGKEYYKELNVKFYEHLNDIGTFCSELSNFTGLEKLLIDFPNFGPLNDQGLKELGNAIQTIPALKNLQLYFSETNLINDDGLQELRVPLKSLESLTTLHLSFWNCNLITDKGLVELERSLKALTSLKDLELSFDGCRKLTNVGVRELSLSFRKLTSLINLRLDFTDCSSVGDFGLKELSIALADMTELEKIYLSFSNCKSISDTGLKELGSAIWNMPFLKDIQLYFGDCRWVGDKGLAELCTAFKNNRSIVNLLLDFSDCKMISDLGANHLCDTIHSMGSLKSLQLYFSGCQSICSDAKTVLKGLMENYKNLVFA